jgi:hypothetical protein
MFEGVLYKKKKGHLADSDSEDDWKSFWLVIAQDPQLKLGCL